MPHRSSNTQSALDQTHVSLTRIEFPIRVVCKTYYPETCSLAFDFMDSKNNLKTFNKFTCSVKEQAPIVTRPAKVLKSLSQVDQDVMNAKIRAARAGSGTTATGDTGSRRRGRGRGKDKRGRGRAGTGASAKGGGGGTRGRGAAHTQPPAPVYPAPHFGGYGGGYGAYAPRFGYGPYGAPPYGPPPFGYPPRMGPRSLAPGIRPPRAPPGGPRKPTGGREPCCLGSSTDPSKLFR